MANAASYPREQKADTVKTVTVTASVEGFFDDKDLHCRYSRTLGPGDDVNEFDLDVDGDTVVITVDTTGLLGDYVWELQDDTTPDILWTGELAVVPKLTNA